VSTNAVSVTAMQGPALADRLERLELGPDRVWVELVSMAFWAPMTVALVAIVLGLLPDQEPALYLASVVCLLFMDAWLLLMLVFSVGRP
jgi:hypothetical protein